MKHTNRKTLIMKQDTFNRLLEQLKQPSGITQIISARNKPTNLISNRKHRSYSNQITKQFKFSEYKQEHVVEPSSYLKLPKLSYREFPFKEIQYRNQFHY